MAIVIGPYWTNFCSQKLKRRISATFGFNRTALHAKQPNLHTIFDAQFLKMALSTSELICPSWSCDLTLLDYYFRGAVKDKCYADKPKTIDALKDNIREVMKYRRRTKKYSYTPGVLNVFKNWTDRVGYSMASRGCYLNEIIFSY